VHETESFLRRWSQSAGPESPPAFCWTERCYHAGSGTCTEVPESSLAPYWYLSRVTLIQSTTSVYCCKIRFNIIHPSSPGSSRQSLPFWL